ncbi:hypothetical protein ABB02_00832 [Clostridiaceae bacterium JG1575]|nr:hypothetical protein ABB02_00832 [Clostridiaceae bacterium JG1575]
MKFIFSPLAGEIFDMFRAMWICHNIEEEKDFKRRYNITHFNDFESSVYELPERHPELIAPAAPFTHGVMKPEFFLDMPYLWESKNITDFLINYAKSLSNKPFFLYTALHSMLNLKEFKELTVEESGTAMQQEIIQNSLELLNTSPMGKRLNSESKWDLFSMVEAPDDFVNQFLTTAFAFLPYYQELVPVRTQVTNNLNQQLTGRAKRGTLEEILHDISDSLNWSRNDTIYITTSATVGVRVFEQENAFYVVLGTYQSEIESSNFHESQLQKTLEVIRTISDPSRFSILSILLRTSADTQELVTRTGLTKANLFYHMNYLIDAKIVNADTSNHTNKYALDVKELYFHLKMFNEYLNYHLNIFE